MIESSPITNARQAILRRKSMSDMQEFSAFRNEESSSQENSHFDPMAVLPAKEEKQSIQSLNEIEESLDGQSYFLGEVPQLFLVDPKGFLPLNSDRMIGSINIVEKLINDVNGLTLEEVGKIQVLQKKINFWEDRIEKNKASIASNEQKIKQNNIDMSYDKKNRDYWWGRAEQVTVDYANAESASRTDDWAWLIKKYGLKNADGTQISPDEKAVEELCNGTSSDLIGEYKNAGNKYEQARRDRETENNILIRENSRHKGSNETLQGYISSTYTKEIEPLQDGVLLLKEFSVKLKAFGQDNKATFGEMRAWAEPFLNDFIKANSRVPQSVVTEFRKLASIPLPAENC
ncbi:MAG: hypothetical protein HW387_1107 [Parachlamydiales bacterium]|nr:hypothetical protein [Parachlamydiales bacterium]